MGVVVITIPGNTQREFANALHEKIGGKVDLVIIQKQKRVSFWKRLGRLRRVSQNPQDFLKELWYAALIRTSRRTQEALHYFRRSSVTHSTAKEFIPAAVEVDSVNSDGVYSLLQKLSPDLLVIWGSVVLAPRILGTAKKAINLHMGYSPYYRGAVANQFAVLYGDLEKVGATIHYATEQVDGGHILSVIRAEAHASPREFFTRLNDRAQAAFLDIASRLFLGEKLEAQPQDTSLGRNFLLKQWTPEVRYKLGRRILAWEEIHEA
jgi:folate-dependent phosphoribosylglycinamide formyltransferase PurN